MRLNWTDLTTIFEKDEQIWSWPASDNGIAQARAVVKEYCLTSEDVKIVEKERDILIICKKDLVYEELDARRKRSHDPVPRKAGNL